MQDSKIEFKDLMKKSMMQVSILGRIVTSKHFINEAISNNERVKIFERLKKHLEPIKKENYGNYLEIEYEMKAIALCIEKMKKDDLKNVVFDDLIKFFRYGEQDFEKVEDKLNKFIKEKGLNIEDMEDNNINYDMDREDIEEYNIDYDMDIEEIMNDYMSKSIISSMKV